MRVYNSIHTMSRRFRIEYTLPLFVLAIILAITGVLWAHSRGNVERVVRTSFDFEVRDTCNRIEQRIQAYEQVLRAARGLFQSSGDVTRAEFKSFVASLELGAKFPGIQGVGFSRIVPGDQRDAHIAAVRAEGFPEYVIKPAGGREFYTSIVYLEPFSGRNLRAFGYDMYSEPTRRAAMDRARVSGQCAMSGKVKLVQETETDVQAGFLIYLPVFKAGAAPNASLRLQDELLGWVYEPFRMNDLMEGILGQHAADLDLEVYDGDGVSEGDLLYQSGEAHASASEKNALQTVSYLDRDERRWTVLLRARPSFKSHLRGNDSLIILAAGMTLSVVLSALVWLLIQGRRRAIRLANQRETRWKQLMGQANDAILLLDSSFQILEANDRATQYLGYSLQELQQTRLEDLFEPNVIFRGENKRNALKALGSTTFELNHRRRDGLTFAGEVSVSTVSFEGTDFFLFVVRDIIDRKRTEEAQQRFERLFRNNPALMALSSLPDRHIQDVNDAFLTTLGYSPDDVIGETAEDLALFADAATRRLVEEGLTANGRVTELELQLRCKDGSLKDGLFSGEVIQSRDERYLLTVMIDISGRKQAEEELRRQSSLINSLLDSIPDIIFFKDTNGVYLGCNPSFTEFVGRTREDIVGKTDYDLFGKGVADLFTANDSIMLQSRTPRHNEELITYPDGRNLLIDTLKTPYWGPDGSLIGVLGISRDITERKHAEIALQESEANFRMFFESMTDMIVVGSLDGRIVFTNSAMARKLGYGTDEIIGMRLLDLHPESRRDEARVIFHAMTRGECDSCPLPLESKRGDCIPVETRVWLGRWNGEECIFGVAKDLTAEQEAQQTLRAAVSKQSRVDGAHHTAGRDLPRRQ